VAAAVNPDPPAPFFWLHIKKAGGTSIRSMLQPHYHEVDRTRHPPCFIESSRAEYNDILNNYRVVLGDYQFRRALFAKTYLYPDQWDRMLSFAFVREPTSRAVSMFHYLFWGPLSHRLQQTYRWRRPSFTRAQSFELFLDCLEEFRAGDSIYYKGDLHFPTHTAAVWDDVSDEKGTVLLSRIYRLESLAPAVNQVLSDCGLPPYEAAMPIKNRVGVKAAYQPTSAQRQRVEKLFPKDFDLYENAIAL
jgi:hypothetical protein